MEYDVETMIPMGVEMFKKLFSEKTVCVLMAYLFGVRYDVTEYVKVAKENNVDLLEDCA